MRNLIGLINEAYLFLINSPKQQQLFDLTLKEYLPENSHGKLPGLCKTHVPRSFPGNVWAACHLSRCCYFPPRVPKPEIVYWSWNWDKDTITKAQGLKASLLSFQTVVVFIASKNILNEVKAAENGPRYFRSLHDDGWRSSWKHQVR